MLSVMLTELNLLSIEKIFYFHFGETAVKLSFCFANSRIRKRISSMHRHNSWNMNSPFVIIRNMYEALFRFYLAAVGLAKTKDFHSNFPCQTVDRCESISIVNLSCARWKDELPQQWMFWILSGLPGYQQSVSFSLPKRLNAVPWINFHCDSIFHLRRP